MWCCPCSNRFDYMSLARRLTGIVTEEGSEESHGEEEEEMEVEWKTRRPGKRYKDQVCTLAVPKVTNTFISGKNQYAYKYALKIQLC